MVMEKRWKIKAADEKQINSLQNQLQIHPALCRLLVVRGIVDFESAKRFFRPTLDMLHDPFLMKGMDQAVQRISQAIASHEKIMVYGDYDVDGTTAVAVVYDFFRKNYTEENLCFYIPHRYREGYGISKQGIDFAHEQGYSLVITLDCGIKSAELIAYARTKNIDVIVCDHHMPDNDLPPAFAILNPKQPNCLYPYKELSGCGIGFKLISALAQHWQLEKNSYLCYLDLVATSIAADIVPMDGENRVLAFYGIEKANQNPALSIQVLKEIALVTKPLTISDLVFVIGPRVNAAGRMDDARKAVELFLETDLDKIRNLAAQLQSDNHERKEIDKSITEEAKQLIENNVHLRERSTTVLYQEHWHKGVVGIVASRLLDYYYRPTIILTHANGKATGSARSVHGFNIYEALHACKDLLENYGGHFYAAGMTLSPDKVEAFSERFEMVVKETISPHALIPELEIDAEIRLSDIKPKFYNIIRQFEPFGPTNLRPVFITRGVTNFKGYSQVVKNKHIKFVVHQGDGIAMEGIGFAMHERYPIVLDGAFDMVYTIEENEYNGNTRLQLKVLDIRPTT
jgi:single-stranded-DNA-specific exonuclease